MDSVRITEEQRRALIQAVSEGDGGWSRRQFIVAGLGAVTAFVLPGCGDDPDPVGAPFEGEFVMAITDVDAAGTVAPQPPIVRAKDGLLRVVFMVAMQEKILNGQPLDLRTYYWTDQPVDVDDPRPTSADWSSFTPGPTLWFPKTPSGTTKLRLTLLNQLTFHDTACITDERFYATNEKGKSKVEGFKGDIAPNCFHGQDITNIHYHGSHVSPSGNGDNVLVKIPPQDKFENIIDFSPTQPPGTHWYHPHKHGSTAIQLNDGLAGAFVIEGDFDIKQDLGEPHPEAHDLVFVLQKLTEKLGDTGTSTINGMVAPITVKMRPGEIQRWRFVNAAVHGVAAASVSFSGDVDDTPSMRTIAVDGCAFTDQQWQHSVPTNVSESLAPGNRMDFLVRAPSATGTHMLELVRTGEAQVIPDGGENERSVAPSGASERLINVEVGGDPLDWTFPPHINQALPIFGTTLRPVLESTDDVSLTEPNRYVQYSQAPGPFQGAAPQFYIDGGQFDASKVNQRAEEGSTELWSIVNHSGTPHPHHIHVNPFQVVEWHGWIPDDPENADGPGRMVTRRFDTDTTAATWREGTDGYARWQDTIALPVTGPAYVSPDPETIRKNIEAGKVPPFDIEGDSPTDPMSGPAWVKVVSRFTEFTGEFVLHCHILGHEDRGMMQTVEVER